MSIRRFEDRHRRSGTWRRFPGWGRWSKETLGAKSDRLSSGEKPESKATHIFVAALLWQSRASKKRLSSLLPAHSQTNWLSCLFLQLLWQKPPYLCAGDPCHRLRYFRWAPLIRRWRRQRQQSQQWRGKLLAVWSSREYPDGKTVRIGPRWRRHSRDRLG